jgi:hypothetical protein
VPASRRCSADASLARRSAHRPAAGGATSRALPPKQIAAFHGVSLDRGKLEAMPAHQYVDLMVRP